MGLTILGVDVSDKSNYEIKEIVQKLGLNDLSTESLNRLYGLDKEIKEAWVHNPDSIEPFTNESVKIICDSIVKKSNEQTVVTDFHDLTDEEQRIIFSQNFEKQLKRIDLSGQERAIEKSSNSFDRQAAHYDYVHFILENTFDKLSKSAIDYVSEQTVIGSYDYHRDQYIKEMVASGKMLDPYVFGNDDTSNRPPKISNDKQKSLPDDIFSDEKKSDKNKPVKNGVNKTKMSLPDDVISERVERTNYASAKNAMDIIRSNSFYSKEETENMKACGRSGEDKAIINGLIMSNTKNTKILSNGGKIVFKQVSGDVNDLGGYLQSRISDIETAVGDELGIEDDNKQMIFITPSTPIGLQTQDSRNSFLVIYSDKIPHDAHNVISNTIKEELAQRGFDVEVGNVYSILESELNTVRATYHSDSSDYSISHQMLNELNHAKEVLDSGYDQYGYNGDGYDETGHSADGEYNAMYDKSFMDDGPDI